MPRHCILKPVPDVDCDLFEEKPDTEDATQPGGNGVSSEALPSHAADPKSDGDTPAADVPGGLADDDGVHYRQDAIGR